MKKTIASLFTLCMTLCVQAQSNDPVVMTVNGTPVTRSEFEYAYNKNGQIAGAVEQKTVAEYAEMYANYKLKVAAALEARIDTLKSYQQEYEQYKNIQLMPSLVDEAYIDSVARSAYDQTKQRLDGHDMLRLAHILLLVPQSATQAETEQTATRADSIYKVVMAGGDFAALAKTFSGDPGSASRGGELPWIGPGMTIKEFEEAAYKLQTGEISQPVKTTVGFHIIKMLERKTLAPYDSLKNEIYTALKRQGIEEASAENRIKKMIAESGGTLTREKILDDVQAKISAEDINVKYLIQEYHDGLLLYEISKQTIYEPTEKDTKALTKQFKKNKSKYTWDEPRFKGFVIYAKNDEALKDAQKLLKKYGEKDWRKALKQTINKDSITVRVSGPMLVKKGDNKTVDHFVFGSEEFKANEKFPVAGVYGKTLEVPKSYLDVKSQVLTDLQEAREKEWVNSLRERMPVIIDQEALKNVRVVLPVN